MASILLPQGSPAQAGGLQLLIPFLRSSPLGQEFDQYLGDVSWLTFIPWHWEAHPADAKSHQSCRTLCNPRDGSPPGSPVPGILQARTLEWVAIFFSSAWKWKVKVKSLSRVRLLVTPWTTAHQAPLSMWFSRQEYWSGVPLPSPEAHPSPGENSSYATPGVKFWTRPHQ